MVRAPSLGLTFPGFRHLFGDRAIKLWVRWLTQWWHVLLSNTGNNNGSCFIKLLEDYEMYHEKAFSTVSAAAAAAKSLQSCPTVWPHRRQATRIPHPWNSPGKNTGVGCHFLLQCMKVKSESEVAQSCPTLATPWTAAYQAPPPMGFSRQEYWSGVPLPSPSTVSGSQ